MSSSMAFENIPVHVALAANGLMAGGSCKRDEYGGDGEEDGDDLVLLVHAEGMTARGALGKSNVARRIVKSRMRFAAFEGGTLCDYVL